MKKEITIRLCQKRLSFKILIQTEYDVETQPSNRQMGDIQTEKNVRAI